jgi:hypothetical protein
MRMLDVLMRVSLVSFSLISFLFLAMVYSQPDRWTKLTTGNTIVHWRFFQNGRSGCS